MRWQQTVGMVRWCRIHPDLKENLSGGVGFVRWCRFGLWDFPWDLLDGNRVGVDVGGPTSTFSDWRISEWSLQNGLHSANFN